MRVVGWPIYMYHGFHGLGKDIGYLYISAYWNGVGLGYQKTKQGGIMEDLMVYIMVYIILAMFGTFCGSIGFSLVYFKVLDSIRTRSLYKEIITHQKNIDKIKFELNTLKIEENRRINVKL